MKLRFTKENDNMQVHILNGNKLIDFDYICMINMLYNDRNLESSEFLGEISADEKTNIEEMLNEISQKVIDLQSDVKSQG